MCRCALALNSALPGSSSTILLGSTPGMEEGENCNQWRRSRSFPFYCLVPHRHMVWQADRQGNSIHSSPSCLLAHRGQRDHTTRGKSSELAINCRANSLTRRLSLSGTYFFSRSIVPSRLINGSILASAARNPGSRVLRAGRNLQKSQLCRRGFAQARSYETVNGFRSTTLLHGNNPPEFRLCGGGTGLYTCRCFFLSKAMRDRDNKRLRHLQSYILLEA